MILCSKKTGLAWVGLLLLLTGCSTFGVVIAEGDQTCSVDDESCQANDNGPTRNEKCKDKRDECETWASQGECTNNPNYMLINCKKSCVVCSEFIYTKEHLEKGLDMGVSQVLDSGAAKVIQSARQYLKKDEVQPHVKKICLNEHENCSYWASLGECDANENYMKNHCAAACQSCIHKTVEGRCPIDPDAPQAWGPGDLDAMFTRLTSEPYLSEYDVKTLSSPKTTNGPWVITMENIITKEEAEKLVELGALEGYQRSSDVGKLNPDGTHERHVNEGRTSTNAWCQNECYQDEISQRVVHRLSNVTGIPEINSEYLQLLRYEPGQHYQAHHDYIPHHIRRQPGVRILTMYLYLSDVEAGGGTNFDSLDITVMPKVGRALLWPSVLNNDPNEKDGRTTHQALPVEAGIKYGANAWFHMRDFKGPLQRRCE